MFSGNGYIEYYKTGDSIKRKIYSGDKIDISDMADTDANGCVCYKVSFASVSQTLNIIIYKGSAASMYLKTGKGLTRLQLNKNLRDNSTLALYINREGGIEYNDISAKTLSELKCRGNSSFNDFQKKPYQIKLGAKAGFEGMKKAKTWILLSGAYDKSMLRNAAATALANALSMPYTPDFTYVDLYIDGQYQGLYLLIEKVQIANNRIDITSLEDANVEANAGTELSSIRSISRTLRDPGNLSFIRYVPIPKIPSDITGGYLVELDNLYFNAEPSIFITSVNNHYVLKSPEYASSSEVMYISGIISEMEEALYSENGYNSYGRHYSEYIDISSLAKNYIVRELMKDWDGFNGSLFFYKDADKNGITSELYLGPIWDFDLSLDNTAAEQYYRDSNLWCQGEGENPGSSRTFGKYLMSHPEMKALVAEYYEIARVEAENICAQGAYLDDLKEMILESDMMERSRWDARGYSRHFSNGIDTDATTYAGEVKNYLQTRARKLVPYIGTYSIDSEYYSVTLSPELEGKIKLCCEYYYGGRRAAVRVLLSADIRLVAEYGNGKTITLEKSSTGSAYESGILFFYMPKANVVIKAA